MENKENISEEKDNINKTITEIDYFGTDINNHGHYFWRLTGNKIEKTKVWFKDLPFNPEELLPAFSQKGTVKYFRVGDYAICAIAGSCYDSRNGTKSIFWTKEPIKLGDLKGIILSIPIAKKIIEQMQFDIDWKLSE